MHPNVPKKNNKSNTLSRRSFLTAGAITVAIAPTLCTSAWGAPAAELSPVLSTHGNTDYLAGAISAAAWIRSAQREAPEGTRWLPEPDHPEKLTTISPANGIYSGSAGIVLFFLELAAATGDQTYLEDAKKGADVLASTWHDDPVEAEKIPGLRFSFYNGLAGVAFALIETWKATGDRRYKEAAVLATEYLVGSAKTTPSGLAWSAAPGVIGDGSVILYLLFAGAALKDEHYIKTAVLAGERLLAAGRPYAGGGLSWQGAPSSALGLPDDAYFPNFEMGTAGVAFVLARLYEETRDKRFLYAATQGALHLQHIATVKGEGALVSYRYPDLKEVYYLGFCHGPAGTARLFYQLYKVTDDPIYLQWTERLARGVIDSNVPENQTPGLWNVVCQCCGSAGLTSFFLGLWAATNQPEYYAYANQFAGHTLSHQTDFDGKGARWYQAWTRVKPADVTAETGYSIGAAGVGVALIQASLARQGKYQVIGFPDNPFPTHQAKVSSLSENHEQVSSLAPFEP